MPSAAKRHRAGTERVPDRCLDSPGSIVPGVLVAYFCNVTNLSLRTTTSYIFFASSTRKLAWSNAAARELWTFSRFIVVASISTVLIFQIDKAFFARTLSLSDFGIYTIAATLATAPIALAQPFAHKVLYPFLSRVNLDTPSRLRSGFYSRTSLIVSLYTFLVGGLIGAAPLVVELMYDPRYSAVTPLLRILSVSTMFAMCNICAEQLIVVLGKTAAVMTANVIRLGFLVAGISLAVVMSRPHIVIFFVGFIELPVLVFYSLVRVRHDVFNTKREFLIILLGAAGIVIGSFGSSAILRLYEAFK